MLRPPLGKISGVYPFLFVVRVGGFAVPIGSYGVLLCAAIGLVAFGVLRSAHREKLDLGASIAALGATTAGGFFGAWLLHALVQSVRLRSLTLGFATPGLAIFGALFGGLGALLFVGKMLDLRVLVLADLGVPWLACGQAVGRLGCLFGGCCFGRPLAGPFALHYRDPLAPAASALGRHAWPLYEAASLLLLAAVLASRPTLEPGSGRRVLLYLAAYSALRLLLEPLRGDAVRGVFFTGLASSAQLVAAAVLLGCAAFFVRRTQRDLA